MTELIDRLHQAYLSDMERPVSAGVGTLTPATPPARPMASNSGKPWANVPGDRLQWAAEHEDIAQQLADVENPSRQAWEGTGLPRMSRSDRRQYAQDLRKLGFGTTRLEDTERGRPTRVVDYQELQRQRAQGSEPQQPETKRPQSAIYSEAADQARASGDTRRADELEQVAQQEAISERERERRRGLTTFERIEKLATEDTHAGQAALGMVGLVTDFLPRALHGVRANIESVMRATIGDKATEGFRKYARFTPGAVLVGDMPELEKWLDVSGDFRQETRRQWMQAAQEQGGTTARYAAEITDGLMDTVLTLIAFKAMGVAYGAGPATAATKAVPKWLARATQNPVIRSNAMRSIAVAKHAAVRALARTGTTEQPTLKDAIKSFGISLAYQSTPAVSGWFNSNVAAITADIAQNAAISAFQVRGIVESAKERGFAEAMAAGTPEKAEELGAMYANIALLQTFGSDIVFGAMTRSFRREMGTGRAQRPDVPEMIRDINDRAEAQKVPDGKLLPETEADREAFEQAAAAAPDPRRPPVVPDGVRVDESGRPVRDAESLGYLAKQLDIPEADVARMPKDMQERLLTDPDALQRMSADILGDRERLAAEAAEREPPRPEPKPEPPRPEPKPEPPRPEPKPETKPESPPAPNPAKTLADLQARLDALPTMAEKQATLDAWRADPANAEAVREIEVEQSFRVTPQQALAEGRYVSRPTDAEPDLSTADTAFYGGSRFADGFLYRGIEGEAALADIASKGQITSTSEAAKRLGKNAHVGMTFLTDYPNIASSYVQRDGYVLEIRMPQDITAEGGGEIQTTRPIPADRISRVFAVGTDAEGPYSIDVTDRFTSPLTLRPDGRLAGLEREAAAPKPAAPPITGRKPDVTTPTPAPEPGKLSESVRKTLLSLPPERQAHPFGPQLASLRQQIMQELTGKKIPKAKAGATAVRDALLAAAGISKEGKSINQYERELIEWLRAPDAKTEEPSPPPKRRGLKPKPPVPPADDSGPVTTRDRPDEITSQRVLAIPTDDVPENQRFVAVTPQEDVRVQGAWRVIGAGDLVSSDKPGYDSAMQPRDRGTMASKEQIERIAAKPDPLRLFDSAVTDGGAPIIDPRGQVVSGNGRSIGIRNAYERGTAGPYREAVVARAQAMGLDASGIKNPVLVRELRDTGKATLAKVAELSNREQILQRTTTEMAIADAKVLLDPETNIMRLWNPDTMGNIRVASNREFLKAFLNATGDQSLRNADGSFSPFIEGRVQRAILSAILGRDDDGRKIVRVAIEQAEDLGVRQILNGITRAGGRLIRLGHEKPEYDIRDPLAGAFRLIMEYKNRYLAQSVKMKEDFITDLEQANWFAKPKDPEQMLLAKAIWERRRSAKSLYDLLNAYVDRASKEDTVTKMMFDDVEPMSREAMLKGVIREQSAETQGTPDLVGTDPAQPAQPDVRTDTGGGRSDKGRPRRGRRGSSETGGAREPDVGRTPPEPTKPTPRDEDDGPGLFAKKGAEDVAGNRDAPEEKATSDAARMAEDAQRIEDEQARGGFVETGAAERIAALARRAAERFFGHFRAFGKAYVSDRPLMKRLEQAYHERGAAVEKGISDVNRILKAAGDRTLKDSLSVVFALEESGMGRADLPESARPLYDAAKRVVDAITKMEQDAGTLGEGFPEGTRRVIQQRIDTIVNKENPTAADRKQLQSLTEDLQSLEKFSGYMPHSVVARRVMQAIFEEGNDRGRRDFANRLEQFHHQRKGRATLREYAKAGIIKPDDIDIGKLLMSMTVSAYQRMSMKSLVDYGFDNGYIQYGQKAPGSPKDWFEVSQLAPSAQVFKIPVPAGQKAWVHRLFGLGLEELSGAASGRTTALDKLLSMAKVGQFYQPRIIWSYNLQQRVYGGAVEWNPVRDIKNTNDAWRAVLSGNKDYQEANRLGIFQMPENLPRATVEQQMDLIARRTRADIVKGGRLANQMQKVLEQATGQRMDAKNWSERGLGALVDAAMLPIKSIANATWTGDQVQRMHTFYNLTRRGMPPEHAANKVADMHGAYSKIGPGYKSWARWLFFVYSFRLLMPIQTVRAYATPIKLALDKMAGREIPKGETGRAIKALAGTILFPTVLDSALRYLGWTPTEEEDEFFEKGLLRHLRIPIGDTGYRITLALPNWKYKKTFMRDGEEREVVVGINNIVNMGTKWLMRSQPRLGVVSPDMKNLAVWTLLKWEINPLYRTAIDIFENESSFGTPPPRGVDGRDWAGAIGYLAGNIFRLYGDVFRFAQDDPDSNVYRKRQREELKEALGFGDRVLTHTFGYAYTRADKERRAEAQIGALKRSVGQARSTAMRHYKDSLLEEELAHLDRLEFDQESKIRERYGMPQELPERRGSIIHSAIRPNASDEHVARARRLLAELSEDDRLAAYRQAIRRLVNQDTKSEYASRYRRVLRSIQPKE